jgi:outer membrane immunogenic protein
MIRRIALGALALLASAGAAGAADLPTKKSPPPPPPAPVFTWDGFYLGGQIGGGWATDKMSESTAFVPPQTGSASLGESGVIGGAHAGYNWQFGSMVAGLEGDFEGTSLRKSSNCLTQDAGVGNIAPGTCFPSFLAYSFRTALPWQSSARARLGYAFGNFLVYGTGGIAMADISTSYKESFPGFAGIGMGSQLFDRTAVGFTVGGGVEYAINANWSARAEYRFSDFGKVSNPITSVDLFFWNNYSNRHSVDENAVLFGISYKFDALSPVPAVAAR